LNVCSFARRPQRVDFSGSPDNDLAMLDVARLGIQLDTSKGEQAADL